MTDEKPVDLDALEALIAAATPAPWRDCRHDDGGCQCGHVWSLPVDMVVARCYDEQPDGSLGLAAQKANARLIAAMRNALPALLADLARLRAIEAAAEALIAPHGSLDDMRNVGSDQRAVTIERLRAALDAVKEKP